MGPNVEFIITQSVMQCNKEGPDMAAINSLGGQYSTTYWGGGPTYSATDSLGKYDRLPAHLHMVGHVVKLHLELGLRERYLTRRKKLSTNAYRKMVKDGQSQDLYVRC